MSQLILKAMYLYASTGLIILIAILLLSAFSKKIERFKYAQKLNHLKHNRFLRKIGTFAYELYKWNGAALLMLFTPISILLIFTYLLNLLALRRIFKNQSTKQYYHPFNQYKLLLSLIIEKYEEAFRLYSLGFWCFSMTLLLNVVPMSPLGTLFTVAIVQLWPLLIMLEIFVKSQHTEKVRRKRGNIALLLQMITLNLVGPILLCIVSKKNTAGELNGNIK